MKERPILFSAPMVNAILDGKKTQTRRVVKPYEPNFRTVTVPQGVVCRNEDGFTYRSTCPYGQVGDQLWVRESFNYSTDKELHPDEKPNPAPQRSNYLSKHLVYAADGVKSHPEFGKARWKPSIHMPRWASRIQLEITDIGVERLQDISEEDAKSEGIIFAGKSVNGFDMYAHHGAVHTMKELGGSGDSKLADVEFIGRTAKQAFMKLWQKINGAESWDKNPWVWVIEFERIKP